MDLVVGVVNALAPLIDQRTVPSRWTMRYSIEDWVRGGAGFVDESADIREVVGMDDARHKWRALLPMKSPPG